MSENMEQKIKETAIEAIELAQKMRKETNENFVIHVSIPKRQRTATVTIQAAKRPFSINKAALIIKKLRGRWNKTQTQCNFTKLTSIRHASEVKLIINLYTGECLNPESWKNVKIAKGKRGRVLTPDLCNGAELVIMQGLGVNSEP